MRGGVGYGDMKTRLHAAYEAAFAPLCERRRQIARDETYIGSVLREGAGRARVIARDVIDAASEACGIACSAPR